MAGLINWSSARTAPSLAKMGQMRVVQKKSLGVAATKINPTPIAMNNNYDALISASSARYGVPFAWVKAVIGNESNFNPTAYRAEPRLGDASYGLMQLLSETARGLGWSGEDAEELYDPELNIELGTKYLADLRARYGDDFRRVYSAYNSGRPDLWETSAQVRHNVDRAQGWLEQVITEHPIAAAAAGGGAILAALALFAFFRKRGK